MPAPVKPKLVNRGPAGLLSKVPKTPGQAAAAKEEASKHGPLNFIRCKGAEVVDIASLVPDPNNARLHPERNLESIKASLSAYGQVKALVVRQSDRVVLAGNGTMEAAIALGWDKIAINLVDMGDAEGAGYGLADNRSAEFAKWDFKVVSQLEKLVKEAQFPMVGWTLDELEVLRSADWTPPEIDNEASDGTDLLKLSVHFTREQYDIVDKAIQTLRDYMLVEDKESPDTAGCITQICEEWMALLTINTNGQ